MRAASLLLPAVLLLGCLGSPAPGVGGGAACAPGELATLHAPYDEESRLPRVAGRPFEMLYWAYPPEAASLRVMTDPPAPGGVDPAKGPAESGPEGLTHEVGAGGLAFGAYRVPTTPEQGAVNLRVAPASGPCEHVSMDAGGVLLPPAEANQTGRLGVGVMVRTAGFWVNGTTFYTNLAEVDENARIPKGYLGDYAGDDPLPVYVYADGERTMPKRYYDAGFYTTIAGFNNALRDIAVGAPRAVYMTPEEGYTRVGAENHPLYGDPLVFWIVALEVVDLPCPLPQPACDVPVYPARVPPLPVLTR